MNAAIIEAERITPNLVRRTGGGWLAIAPKEAKITLGVTAPSEDEAKEKFRSVLGRWIEILNSGSYTEST